MDKKSQMKMFETIAVLVVFFFILAIGLVFYFNIQKKSIGTTQEEFSELRDVQIAQLISNMPELECPTTLETENCVDEYKLKIGQLDKGYYYDFFGYSTLIVNVYDIETKTWGDYTIYNNPKGESSSRINVPASIYDPINKIKKFGILNITIYK